MNRLLLALIMVLVASACANDRVVLGEPPPQDQQHHDRFTGLWVVEQPTHALYEATYYLFQASGDLITGSSIDLGGHLSLHGVTGSVANCNPAIGNDVCEGNTTCIFGDEWYSLDASTLFIVGDCSDGSARAIRLAFNQDSSSNTESTGGGAVLVSVGGEANWSHDNWPWSFRKCPPDSTESGCGPDFTLPHRG